MSYAPPRQENAARNIARSAQQQIRTRTGINVDMLLYSNESLVETPEKMLKVIAISLGMHPASFKVKSRLRDIAEMRFLGAVFLRKHFPKLTLQQIASLFGGQDHSSILNGIARAHSLIYAGDLRFISKYKAVLNSVNLWLRREVSVSASVISA